LGIDVITVYAIHAPDAAKLGEVKALMMEMGAPKIRVVDCGDYFVALEGSRRLAAADALGITPDFDVLAQDDLIDISGYDWFDAANWGGTEYAAGEVAGELYDPRSVDYRFDA